MFQIGATHVPRVQVDNIDVEKGNTNNARHIEKTKIIELNIAARNSSHCLPPSKELQSLPKTPARTNYNGPLPPVIVPDIHK